MAAVLRNNLDLVEEMTNVMEPNQNIQYLQQCVQKALQYLVQLSQIPEDELFKICLDFWNFFCENVMVKVKGHQYFAQLDERGFPVYNGQHFLNFSGSLLGGNFLQSQVYPPVLEAVRQTLVDNMVKPKEVLVVQDENGEAVEEVFDDTETISIYEQMRETLIYLTNIDTQAMDKVIQERLDKLTGDKAYFSFERLNKLCWALGSISGCMQVEDENKFVVSVIKELLNLCEKTSGKSNKALVAADIMYVVGQFPRFLCSHWPFLKTVVKKLNEFMHEKHPGVQDMASETFLKIAKLTKHMFVQRHDADKDPYICELIRHLPEHQRDLEPRQKLLIYEGIGYMISEEKLAANQERLLAELMQYVHFDWEQVLNLVNMNPEQLYTAEIIKTIDFIIKVNTRVAEAVGFIYLSYLHRIFNDLLKMYGIYSNSISQHVQVVARNDHALKTMRALRKDILRLVQTYIERSTELQIFNEHFLPRLLGLVEDFRLNDPSARDPEVLMLFATMFRRLGLGLNGYLEQILLNLCDSALEMIKNDYLSAPDFRDGLFRLVESIIKHCLSGLLQLSWDKFETVIHTVLFACKHEKPEHMEIGLETLLALNAFIMQTPQVANVVYKGFYLLMIRDILTIMTDYRHVSGFKLQAQILQQMLQIVEGNNVLTERLCVDQTPHQFADNKQFVISLLIDCISTLFQNLNKVQIEAFVLNLFNFCHDWPKFKATLRDLLISMKSYSASNDDFYQEEKKVSISLTC